MSINKLTCHVRNEALHILLPGTPRISVVQDPVILEMFIGGVNSGSTKAGVRGREHEMPYGVSRKIAFIALKHVKFAQRRCHE